MRPKLDSLDIISTNYLPSIGQGDSSQIGSGGSEDLYEEKRILIASGKSKHGIKKASAKVHGSEVAFQRVCENRKAWRGRNGRRADHLVTMRNHK